MKVSDLLETRAAQWKELEALCRPTKFQRQSAETQLRFARLYRAACADLALADAYPLPPETIVYLHELVGHAHHQLYRSRPFQLRTWLRELVTVLPRRLYRDPYLRVALCLFWGVFALCAILAARSPEFARDVVSADLLHHIEEMYTDRDKPRLADESTGAFGFYAGHNSTIGLRCFAFGLAFGIGGLFETVFNAVLLGVLYGYMSGVPQWENFRNFVTAHGPFELTAVVLSAAAGMRLGFALVATGGRKRSAALRLAARDAAPVISAAVLLFVVAGLIEAFLSPADLPYAVKAGVAIASVLLLLFYYLILGSRAEAA